MNNFCNQKNIEFSAKQTDTNALKSLETIGLNQELFFSVDINLTLEEGKWLVMLIKLEIYNFVFWNNEKKNIFTL